MLLRTVLPIGLMGLMMSAYFSAIMSTADSCLVAASGNVTTDIIGKIFGIESSSKSLIRLSMVVTLILGVVALILAASMETVLDIMLYSYAFMVSGLLVPIVGALYWKKSSSAGAISAMISGGSITLILTLTGIDLPFGLDPNIYGITASFLTFVIVSLYLPDKAKV